MKKGLKALLIAAILLLTVVLATSCSGANTPYDEYDKEGYTVSVQYNANGGVFSTNTDIITDTYDISSLPGNGSTKSLMLIAPENPVRGKGNYFTPSKSGYFLAGWYEKDENGNLSKWYFDTEKLTIDTTKEYSASTPALVLYAAWVPEFSFNFINKATGQSIGEYKFNPLRVSSTIDMPVWNLDKGSIDNRSFPAVNGYTFDAAYLDAEGTMLVGDTLTHSGTFIEDSAQSENPVQNIYVDLREGNWYKISTAEQFVDHLNIRGCYEILADLDFSNIKEWPAGVMHGEFVGKIIGNGHKLTNINAIQTNNGKMNNGLFGKIGSTAVITDLAIENATLTIKAGARSAGATIGLLAGTIADGATLTGLTVSGKLLVSSAISCIFSNDYSMGLICGYGDVSQFDLSLVSCEVAPKEENGTYQKLEITTDGNEVTIVANGLDENN